MTAPVDPHLGAGVGPGLLAAARCLALDSLAARTADLLTSAGVSTVLLKGPATAARLLGDRRDQRVYTDVDLLVAPDQFAAAQQVLQSNGYRSGLVGLRDSEWVWHERPWRAPAADLTVDLHRGFAGVQDPAAFWAAVWAARDSLAVAGELIAVPGPVAAALILALHAASPGPLRRKPLNDLVQARAVLSPSVWAAAGTLAREVDAEPACRMGLELLPDGAVFADQVGVAARVPASRRLTGTQRSQLSVSMAMVFEMSSVAELTTYVARKLLPSPALLRLRDDRIGPGRPAMVRGYLRRWAKAAAGSRLAVRELRQALRVGTDRTPPRAAPSLDIARFIRIVVSPGAARTLLWSLRMVGRIREQVPQRSFRDIALSAPPALDRRSRSAVNAGLRLRRATCLEQALLRQRFDAANGVDRTLIIAVSSPANGFRAHSWLEGEPQRDQSLREIVRHPAPRRWLGPRR